MDFTSVLNLLQHYFYLMFFWFSGCEACEILVPQPGIGPASLVLEAEVLTTGPPGKSHRIYLLFFILMKMLSKCSGKFHLQ